MLREIIWDWNGTLLDDTQACVNAINHMLARRNLEQIDMVAYRNLFGFPVIDFYRQLKFKLDLEDWDALSQEFHALFLSDSTLRLHPETQRILSDLNMLGVEQSILSASEQVILDTMLTHYAIDHYFKHVIGADNLHGRSKLENSQQLIDKIVCPRSEVVIIGDTVHDAEVAEKLGVACILVAHGHQSRTRLEKTQRPVIDRLNELPLIFATHFGN